jgi:hypothetical protein
MIRRPKGDFDGLIRTVEGKEPPMSSGSDLTLIRDYWLC